MTTNKPGSVNQQPLYGCTSCYEDWTWPAGDLRVFGSECWCDLCWDERRWGFPDLPYWDELEPYTPALQAECALLREQRDAMAEHKMAAHQLVGIPASVGICEPIEGFAARPQDIMPAVRDMALRIEALEAENERLRKEVVALADRVEKLEAENQRLYNRAVDAEEWAEQWRDDFMQLQLSAYPHDSPGITQGGHLVVVRG